MLHGRKVLTCPGSGRIMYKSSKPVWALRIHVYKIGMFLWLIKHSGRLEVAFLVAKYLLPAAKSTCRDSTACNRGTTVYCKKN